MATEPWIVNASPLILLGKAGLLELLAHLAEVVLIPEAVRDEIAAGPEGARLLEDLRREERFRFHPHAPIPETLMAWDLGAGETQVVAAASLSSCRVVLDDLQARRCARAMGLRIIGTLGVVGRAKRLGVIEKVRPSLDQLLQVGLYATDDLVEQILREAGE